jgi:NAD(P)H-dependent flavin oxidoreductase YrpB (nitropropane dioxygenase family)
LYSRSVYPAGISRILEQIGVELPVVQAGMGGGVARHELAAAVSEAGGLGTLGILPPEALAQELAAARRLTAKPIAVNLLLPFTRRDHCRIADDADVVVTFWGRPKRLSPGIWLHQCGSADEAKAALAAGADGIIAQGVEAGGHVRGEVPALELLEQIRSATPSGYPVMLAGGIANRGDVTAALEAGADAAVLGSRFLLSKESRAHPVYKQRLLAGDQTQLTELFGLGWPAAPHRVLPNAATRRWTAGDARGPAWVRAANRAISPVASRMPIGLQSSFAGMQSPKRPLLSPQPPVDDQEASLLESGPLYAGETIARISSMQPAATIVGELV